MENANESKSHGLDSLKLVETDEGTASQFDSQFVLVNPKDPDTVTQSLLQEILSLYLKELPAMNYAANTGKQSSFIQRCVSSGKFCSLILSENSLEGPHKVIAAVTYQIIPADTQQAEIPLAAVSSTYQLKGIGRLLYMELRKRLQDVGIVTILCWGDKESEGFWQKQGFVPIAEVGTKGRARKLPIKAEIRRALCFPGGSTLMISHLNKNPHDVYPHFIKLKLYSPEKTTSSNEMFYSLAGTREVSAPPTSATRKSPGQGNLQIELNETDSAENCQQLVPAEIMDFDSNGDLASAKVPAKEISSTYVRKAKRKVWETSSSSLNSKRVKATHLGDYQQYPDSALDLDKKHKNDSPSKDFQGTNVYNIMLMDIADGPKKTYLTKTIEDLGGTVTANGSLCTHVLTGKVRRTLKFCTALCSGAWILSPHWLKISSREGSFVDEEPFILKDEDYLIKFKADLKEAVSRARKNPRGLLYGYRISLTTHVHPPVELLSAIVRSAGGEVNVGLGDVEKSETIFIACEEDMEEALLSVKNGVHTFSSDWFMNCIMKQELDLDAPQFAESL